MDSFKVYFNNIPEGHRHMWIYTMYTGMSTGKHNDKLINCLYGFRWDSCLVNR